MSATKEEVKKKFEEMRELLRPEAEIHKAAICMTEMLMMFFDYLEERRDDYEMFLERRRNGLPE